RGIKITAEIKSALEKILQKGGSVEEAIKTAPQEKMLETIVTFVLLMRGTDLHIEPTGNEVLVRYRIDGILQDIAKIPKVSHLPLIGEIKILGGMKTKVHAGVQEGRFNIDFAGRNMDTRLSIIVGGYGETAVIRILGISGEVAELELSRMGIRPEIYPLLEMEIRKPTGIILNTGPTGSGKTTTLYAILTKLNVRGMKIMTIEDPIEYRLAGILQTQVNEAENYTFAKALRSFLRQNPNIIMLGEIRDEETAKTAIQAALTGHLVLSTLHTNDAAGAVQRLTNLGINSGDIASAFNAFLAQRLVRKLCQKCKEAYRPDENILKLIEAQLANIPASIKKPDFKKFYKPIGCAECNNLGYRGQLGLFEILIKNEKIQELVSKNASTLEIK
ncbi:MAG: GspE/PulE family protein, partial [bacterium]|nr:GspE/PulE family protein [bacterium]